MSVNRITVTLPDHLYRRLQSLANKTNQEIETMLIASAEAMLGIDDQDSSLPPEVADQLAAMRLFSDERLWQAAKSRLSADQQAQLDLLTQKQAESPLTDSEQNTLNQLLAEYDRSVLFRAQALALLALRGHQIPDLNMPQPN